MELTSPPPLKVFRKIDSDTSLTSEQKEIVDLKRKMRFCFVTIIKLMKSNKSQIMLRFRV